jgi:hypothetical protein
MTYPSQRFARFTAWSVVAFLFATLVVPGLLVLFFFSMIGLDADAAEGSIPVRPGDVVRGTLARCGDRHVFETELARGETLRVRVTLPDPTAPPTLGVETVDGTDLTFAAHVVGGEGVVTMGPFRAPESGVYRVTLTSSAANSIGYVWTSTIKRVTRRDVRLPADGRAASVLVEAGARFTLRTRRGATPRVTIAFPGEAPRELAADDPLLAALAGAGLSAPTSGSYTFAVASTRGARIAVAAPTYAARQTIDFPALPGDDAVTTWYPASGWVATPGASAPSGHDPNPAPVVEEAPVPVELSTPLTQVVAAPAPTPATDDATTWLGPAAGVGMPLAGAPSLAEVFASGGAPTAANGYAYQVTAPRPGFGDVAYRVRFTVDGRPSAAPLSLTGRVTMSWSVTSAAAYHDGSWTLTFDAVRGVQVLDGSETLTDGAGRTTSVAARGFALSDAATNWPSGALTWRHDDPRAGTSVARSETYDGTSTVGVVATSN